MNVKKKSGEHVLVAPEDQLLDKTRLLTLGDELRPKRLGELSAKTVFGERESKVDTTVVWAETLERMKEKPPEVFTPEIPELMGERTAEKIVVTARTPAEIEDHPEIELVEVARIPAKVSGEKPGSFFLVKGDADAIKNEGIASRLQRALFGTPKECYVKLKEVA